MTQVFDTPIYSSDQSLERVLKAGLPVVLVFRDGAGTAALDQPIKDLARREAGRLLVVLLDRKDSPEAARRFQVQSAPALVTVKDGAAFSRADAPRAADLEAHARYLLGTGPRPQPAASAPRAPAPETARSTPGAGQPSGGAQGLSQPVAVTDASFEQEVLRSPLPVMVDFWAPWCGPCRMVAPILDRLAAELRGRVKIVKVNVDENPQYAGRYGVQAIPTMLIVKDGQVVDQWAGAQPEPAMRQRLARFIQ